MDILGTVIYEKHVAFLPGPFSNFYGCSFELYGETWKSSEQCFMAQKAKHFGDEETYKKILATRTPKEAKELGRQVKNYDDSEWSSVREEIMYNIVYEKFAQNKILRHLMLSEDFKGKKFVEGNPHDSIWGVGLFYLDKKIDDETNWKGSNLLGKTLDRVRISLTH